MNKPASLRAALVAALPPLQSAPDALSVFIDHGTLVATGTRSLSFEYRYVLNVLLLDYAGDADAVMVAIIEWVRANQPDLVIHAEAREDGITFEVDLLNHETADLSIKLKLTESVVVRTDASGRRVIEHVADTQMNAGEAITWSDQSWTI
ncbi:phage tail protein [Mycetohabitans endofungorum]|uniref:phage tail protein n=1 Tax=Mycetohabitans endofungorum TaxID=417203 RepID=UPI0030CFF236